MPIFDSLSFFNYLRDFCDRFSEYLQWSPLLGDLNRPSRQSTQQVRTAEGGGVIKIMYGL